MPSKENIIDNIAQYTASEIAGYIRAGIVTLEELNEEHEFAAPVRKEVKRLLAEAEATGGGKTDSPTSDGTDTIITVTDPRGPYGDTAINRLKKEINNEEDWRQIPNIIKEYIKNGLISVEQIYSEIRENHNWLDTAVIDQLEKEHIINYGLLEQWTGINQKFLKFIVNNDIGSKVINIKAGEINSIATPTTEVYFWGIPSSGKTCALGAITSEARYGGYIDFAEPNNHCQGYNYMTLLSQIFEGSTEVFKLPDGTQTDDIFEMGYVWKRGRIDYPVTLIDLAGETIYSMYCSDAGIELSQKQKTGLDIASRLLTGNSGVNRKIHFFVIEYNGHLRKYQNLTQDTLLTGAMAYIKSSGIVRNDTDAVCLLVTKSDLTGARSEEQRNKMVAEYLKRYYQQFYNGLRDLCEDNEINDGNVDIIPFSIGDVCFKNLCLFDNTTARTVVELIISRAKGSKSGKKANFLNRFRR